MKIAFVYFNKDRCVSRGAGYVASAVLQAGYELDFIDTAYEEMTPAILRVGRCQVLMLSVSSIFWDQAKQFSTDVKRRFPGITILVGGIHVTIVKEVALEECPAIDFICVGEGEEFVTDFLSDPDLLSIPNLGFRSDDGTVKINRSRPCTNLDSLPAFRYDLFQSSSVVQDGPLPGFCYVYATRGCPYRCSYCCNTCYLDLYGPSYLRKRSIDLVIEELLYLKDRYSVKHFYFGDEMILFDEAYVTELFHRVHDEVKLPYGCMGRVERITPAIVDLFKETGCKYVGMGVECGDEEFRKEFLNRRMSNRQIIDAFRSLREVPGITLTSFNMTGYPVPYDSRLTLATDVLNNVLRPDLIQTSKLYPFPGTAIHAYCLDHGLIPGEPYQISVERP